MIWVVSAILIFTLLNWLLIVGLYSLAARLEREGRELLRDEVERLKHLIIQRLN